MNFGTFRGFFLQEKWDMFTATYFLSTRNDFTNRVLVDQSPAFYKVLDLRTTTRFR